MTRDDVIRMVREIADKTTVDPVHGDPPLIVVSPDEMIRFAALVAAAEREAVLNVLWEYAGRKDLSDDDQSLLKHLVDIIRARGET